jgi:hypothetical protein
LTAGRVTTIGVVVLLAASVTACGSSSSASKTVPKAQIISQGDAICSRLKATEPAFPNADPATFTTVQLKLLAPNLAKHGQIIASEVQQVGALGTPSTDQALFKTVLGEGDSAAADFQSAAQAAARGDRPGVVAAFGRLQALPSHGKQFGFHVCDVQT